MSISFSKSFLPHFLHDVPDGISSAGDFVNQISAPSFETMSAT
jgi:hypothetical protein